ncbi:E3 ubiquitin-protein ligase TRIM21-like isoform X2 [Brachyhypopomus gauderio]|uniref:E3 ubiquitin-protein ligase TRIM21-like isoform X2 n=1 Tax=Brachyhypopomus gauderio TaxID=698409 RepID=UPI004042E124
MGKKEMAESSSRRSRKRQIDVLPELKIDTTQREVGDHFKKKKRLDETYFLCDFCTGEKLKAVKSCLHCGVTFCKSHLEPHNNVPNLKKHKLINPVENVNDYRCQKHERPLELFCREDQMCVCQFCTEGEHRTHNTVTIEEESGEKRTQLRKTQSDFREMIHEREKKIEEIKHTVELRKRSIERSQAVLGQARQKAAESKAEGFIKDLEQEITELKRRDSELEQLSHTEDHIHLLKIYPTMNSPPHTKNWTDISIDTDVNVETVIKVLSQLQKTLNNKLIETMNIKLKQAVSTVLKRRQQYAVDVTLDPDTAHPKLILSDDGKQVTHGDTKQNLPDNPKRFDKCPNVLGKERFSSGKFYYEVQVKGKTEWTLGVARESVNRKGKIILTPQNGLWTVALRNENKYSACADPPVLLTLREKPQTVGVFVDYEEGLVSFYDVEARSRIHSYTGQSFTEKLYPFFCPCDNDGDDWIQAPAGTWGMVWLPVDVLIPGFTWGVTLQSEPTIPASLLRHGMKAWHSSTDIYSDNIKTQNFQFLLPSLIV